MQSRGAGTPQRGSNMGTPAGRLLLLRLEDVSVFGELPVDDSEDVDGDHGDRGVAGVAAVDED